MYEIVRYLTNYHANLRDGTAVTTSSPGNVHVFDASGAHVGLNPQGEVDIEIQGALYESFIDAAGAHEFIWVPSTEALSIQFAAHSPGVAGIDIGVVEGGNLDWSRYDDVPVQLGTIISITREDGAQLALVVQPDGQTRVLEPSHSERVLGRVPGGFEPLWGLLGALSCALLVLGSGTAITAVVARKKRPARVALYFLVPLTLGLAALICYLAVAVSGGP
jgi:hypothetical protein